MLKFPTVKFTGAKFAGPLLEKSIRMNVETKIKSVRLRSRMEEKAHT
jgi:hypothetical protein